MIISKTPYRISFFGGGSDYPDWYLKYGGEVLSSTINTHIYITCRYLDRFFKQNHRTSSSCSSIEDINDFLFFLE